MTDLSPPRRAADRQKATARTDDQIRYLSAKYGLTREQIEDLMEQHGHRRARLEAAARSLAD